MTDKEIADVLKIGTWTNRIGDFISACNANGFFDDSENPEAEENMALAYENGDWSAWGNVTSTILIDGWIINV